MTAPAKHTPGPWRFASEGRADSERLEALLAKHEGRDPRPLGPHVGFPRSNDGGWYVTSDEGGIAEVRPQFAIQPKRGTAYNAPDPEGMANARLIASAPELLAVVQMAQAEAVTLKARLPEPYASNMAKLAEACREVLAKAVQP